MGLPLRHACAVDDAQHPPFRFGDQRPCAVNGADGHRRRSAHLFDQMITTHWTLHGANHALRPVEGSRQVGRVGARFAEQAIQLFMKNRGRATEKHRAQEDFPHLDAFSVN